MCQVYVKPLICYDGNVQIDRQTRKHLRIICTKAMLTHNTCTTLLFASTLPNCYTSIVPHLYRGPSHTLRRRGHCSLFVDAAKRKTSETPNIAGNVFQT